MTTNILNLVIEMRRAQKEYFRTRSKDILLVAKKLEAEVDREIAEIENEANISLNEIRKDETGRAKL